MKKKYSMALTNITSLLYKVHKNTHTILHYNNLCTRLLYQHQLSRAYNCSKNASEKNIKGWQKIRKRKKINTDSWNPTSDVNWFHQIPSYGIKNDIPSIIHLSCLIYFIVTEWFLNRGTFHILVRKIKKNVLMCTLVQGGLN